MGRIIKIGGESYCQPVIIGKRQILRGDVQNLSPSQKKFFQNSREELRKELCEEKRQKDEQLTTIAEEISKRLKIGKQQTEVKEPTETAEVAKPQKESTPDNNDKVFKRIAEVLISHKKELDELREAIEALADQIPEYPTRGLRDGESAFRHFDPEVVELRAEALGLTGECRKVF